MIRRWRAHSGKMSGKADIRRPEIDLKYLPNGKEERLLMKPRSWFPRLPILRLTLAGFTLLALCFLLLMGSASARKAKKPAQDAAASQQQTAAATPAAASGDLATVLAKMNQSSSKIGRASCRE